MNSKVLRGIVVILSGLMILLWGYLLYAKIFPKKTETSNAQELGDLSNLQVIPTDFQPPETTSIVQIKNCKSDPENIETKLNSFITLENKDETEQIIQVDPEHIYTIPALGTAYVFMNFNNELGEFPFTCNQNPAGAFVIQ